MASVYSQSEIDAKAGAMAELLLQAVLELDLLEPAWKACSEIRAALDGRAIDGPPDAPDGRAVKRLFFEVVAFAAFTVVGQEVPKSVQT
jgi:hypothetical protein